MDVKCGDIVCLIQMFNNGFHMGYHNKKCGYLNENYAFIYTEKIESLDHKTKLKRAKVLSFSINFFIIIRNKNKDFDLSYSASWWTLLKN